MIEICVLGSEGVLSAVPLSDGKHAVGNTNGAAVPLLFPTVSRQHAELEIHGPTVSIRDVYSRNGTVMNQTPLKAGDAVAWPKTARVRIGPFDLVWRTRNAREAPQEPVLLQKLADIYASRIIGSVALAGDANVVENCLHELDPQRALAAPARLRLTRRVHEEFHGDGPLGDLLQDPRCREILLNDFNEIFADLGTGLQKTPRAFLTAKSYAAWIARTAAFCGRRIDLQNPICEATLPSGARFHAVLPPVSFRAPSVSIRRFGSAPLTEKTAVESGWIAPEALALLKAGVKNKKNIVISGGTSTGKTSLLNFLCQSIEIAERVITIEDTVELSINVNDSVQLQARRPNADGIGAVTLRELVQCALRMRPDRIIVGECRGAEVLDMLQALNTGHPGSLTTIHANSPEEALQRLELLALLGAPNLTIDILHRWIRQSVHWIVQVERSAKGERDVDRILEISPNGTRALYQKHRRQPEHRRKPEENREMDLAPAV